MYLSECNVTIVGDDDSNTVNKLNLTSNDGSAIVLHYSDLTLTGDADVACSGKYGIHSFKLKTAGSEPKIQVNDTAQFTASTTSDDGEACHINTVEDFGGAHTRTITANGGQTITADDVNKGTSLTVSVSDNYNSITVK